MRTLSTLLAALAVSSMLVAAPALADDHHFGGGGSGSRCDGCLVGVGVVAGAFDVAFLAVGIPTLVTGGWFGPGWSTVEIIWGVANALVGIVLTPLGALGLAFNTDGSGAMLGTGVILIIVAAWLITHAIVSLKRYFGQFRKAEPEKKEEAPPPAAQPNDEQVPPPPPPPPPPPLPPLEEQTMLERLLPQLTSAGAGGVSVGLRWTF